MDVMLAGTPFLLVSYVRVASTEQPTPVGVYGRYETLFRIAAGGMAEVYAARALGEAGFQKLVALKRMLPHLTDDERFVTMFMDEGQLAANIQSPNVVSTLDLGRADDGSLYLVMELVVGTTLSGLLRTMAKEKLRCPVPVAVEVIAQAAQGLHDAHEARTPYGEALQIVHRDVSPQNILVGVDGRVRITDFGVARAVLRRTKTSTGEFKGKLSYFSPEQCADKPLDRRSDIFSLGIVAWETLTCRRLFHAENPLAVLKRVTQMQIPRADAVRNSVPTAVADVIETCLSRDPEARFKTSAEFARALRGAAGATCGLADRSEVTSLVQAYGGQGLEKTQTQLRLALEGAPRPSVEPLRPSGDLASGIIVREPDGTFESDEAPTSVSSSLPAHTASGGSRLRLLVAASVALFGLTAASVLGVLALVNDEADTSTVESRGESQLPLASPHTTPEAPDERASAPSQAASAVGANARATPPSSAPSSAPSSTTESSAPRRGAAPPRSRAARRAGTGSPARPPQETNAGAAVAPQIAAAPTTGATPTPEAGTSHADRAPEEGTGNGTPDVAATTQVAPEPTASSDATTTAQVEEATETRQPRRRQRRGREARGAQPPREPATATETGGSGVLVGW